MQRRSFLISATAGAASAQVRAAGLDWPAAAPTDAGFDAALLEAWRADLQSRKTAGLLVLRGGRKVLEWYAPGFDASRKHYTASLAKALVGGTSLMLAIGDGRIRAADRASKFIPSWAGDPRKSKITIKALATHTSGIEDSSVEGYEHGKEPGWKGQFWRREPDPFRVSIHDAPVLFDPGTAFEYSNPGMAALAYCVTASLQGSPWPDIATLLRERVFEPLGIPADQWSIGYGKAYSMDGLDLWANWGGGGFTPRAAARIGEWMMRAGRMGGRARVRPTAAAEAVKYSGMPLPKRDDGDSFRPGSGLCWYTNFDGVWPAVPRDAFAGSGAQQQTLLVVPSLDLVVVRNGGDLDEDARRHPWNATYRRVFEPLMAAMGNPARAEPVPYPKSTVIHGVSFSPSIVRKAEGSDNWPITWGADGLLYTSYGDGNGFEPHTEVKLSMGFAKIDGWPGSFRGVNIRSASGEAKGDGRAGPKASGALMVNGVLYLWVRNTGNARLVWSPDLGRTWRWDFIIKQGFGSPAFLNFGRNYAGARDEYVYTYSQAGPSAYGIDDAIVLARAPKQRLRERAAWEFFDGSADEPHWTADIAGCRPVFAFAKHCQRVDAVYHPLLKRYLMAVSYGHDGGWGLFEAPEPWGPWSTAFHTEYWGLGGTHGYRLPAKWIARDGHSMALVFSGVPYDGVSYDAFCVRRMELQF